MSLYPTTPNGLPDWYVRQMQDEYRRRVQNVFSVDYNHIPAGPGAQQQAVQRPIPQLKIRYKVNNDGAWKELVVIGDITLARLKDRLALGEQQTLGARIECPLIRVEFDIAEECWQKKLSEVLSWVSGFVISDKGKGNKMVRFDDANVKPGGARR
ncbi:unnamed protein product [Zymoseptoria tritici ST99CH_3D7]|uniref:Uncharacterized protein n=1 Tax=Zymoseptoria tritici (strain ST99CH_3D7) TaxID=1276538 RepID=A0A1X7S191_ZYMT9|nr:unnamed protein product [Zymoseptoria tritici ST99CH_3D7]